MVQISNARLLIVNDTNYMAILHGQDRELLYPVGQQFTVIDYEGRCTPAEVARRLRSLSITLFHVLQDVFVVRLHAVYDCGAFVDFRCFRD